MNDTKWTMDPAGYASYLMSGASMQDGLLQSYRSIHLTLQAIFLAVGAGLVAASLTFDTKTQLVVAFLAFIPFCLIGLVSGWGMTKLIKARGKDVNFWHERILQLENHTDPQHRTFTRFKIRQRLTRSNNEDLRAWLSHGETLTQEQIERLIGRGLGHTRKVIDLWLSWGVRATWILLFGLFLYTVTWGPF